MERINEYLNTRSQCEFILLQTISGFFLAAMGGCCILFLGNKDADFNSYGLAAALILCGGLPTLLREKIERPTPWLRWSIIAGLVIFLGTYVGLRFL